MRSWTETWPGCEPSLTTAYCLLKYLTTAVSILTTASLMPTSSVARSLFSGIVDYAGLFPPASLSMEDAVREYATRRLTRERWMLGRFVVPASDLAEFSRVAIAVRSEVSEDESLWPVTVVATDDIEENVEAMRRLHAAQQGAIRPLAISGIETRVSEPEQVRGAVGHLTEFSPERYVEIPLDRDPAPFITAIREVGVRAKARTGGVKPESIPPASQVARFLAECVRQDVPFKLTAGLHHPIRAEYPLTYQENSERAVMHGFLNTFLAVALLHGGGSMEDAVRLLEETDASAFTFGDHSISWRDREFTEVALGDARRLATGFGSCSFAEPVEGLRELGALSDGLGTRSYPGKAAGEERREAPM